MKKYKLQDVEELIRMAIAEDIGRGDVTGEAIFPGEAVTSAVIVAKEQGVFCGGDMISFVYGMINPDIDVLVELADGSAVSPGTIAARIQGCTMDILAGERVMLNFVQRMSGIATRTAKVVESLRGTGITLLDTRKTLPGFRILDKYSVAAGGGMNHRMGLYDMVMIKDNHIDAAGSITSAVDRIRRAYGDIYKIEVEARNLDEVREAIGSGVDIIMFDNMDVETMKIAADIVGGRAKTEISGNMDEARIQGLKGLSVDYISMGALTHSVHAFDLSMIVMGRGEAPG